MLLCGEASRVRMREHMRVRTRVRVRVRGRYRRRPNLAYAFSLKAHPASAFDELERSRVGNLI